MKNRSKRNWLIITERKGGDSEIKKKKSNGEKLKKLLNKPVCNS